MALLILFSVSCSLTMDQINNWDHVNLNKIPFTITDVYGLENYIYGNIPNGIVYNTEKNEIQDRSYVWFNQGIQLPEETIEKGSGICTDQAVLFLALYRKLFHDKGQLVIATMESGKTHSYPRVNGNDYAKEKVKSIIEIIDYDQIGWLISEYHYY